MSFWNLPKKPENKTELPDNAIEIPPNRKHLGDDKKRQQELKRKLSGKSAWTDLTKEEIAAMIRQNDEFAQAQQDLADAIQRGTVNIADVDDETWNRMINGG